MRGHFDALVRRGASAFELRATAAVLGLFDAEPETFGTSHGASVLLLFVR